MANALAENEADPMPSNGYDGSGGGMSGKGGGNAMGQGPPMRPYDRPYDRPPARQDFMAGPPMPMGMTPPMMNNGAGGMGMPMGGHRDGGMGQRDRGPSRPAPSRRPMQPPPLHSR